MHCIVFKSLIIAWDNIMEGRVLVCIFVLYTHLIGVSKTPIGGRMLPIALLIWHWSCMSTVCYDRQACVCMTSRLLASRGVTILQRGHPWNESRYFSSLMLFIDLGNPHIWPSSSLYSYIF